MTTITIKLPEELKHRVEAMARLSGVSVAAVVRQTLDKAMGKSGPANSSIYERTRDLCGSGDSGLADLATNPMHMKGFGE